MLIYTFLQQIRMLKTTCKNTVYFMFYELSLSCMPYNYVFNMNILFATKRDDKTKCKNILTVLFMLCQLYLPCMPYK